MANSIDLNSTIDNGKALAKPYTLHKDGGRKQL